jgi:hypothetical protein
MVGHPEVEQIRHSGRYTGFSSNGRMLVSTMESRKIYASDNIVSIARLSGPGTLYGPEYYRPVQGLFGQESKRVRFVSGSFLNALAANATHKII